MLIVGTDNQKYLLMPLTAEDISKGLPIERTATRDKKRQFKKIGYIPSCQPLGLLSSIIKNFYQIRVAYYPTATFLFEPSYTGNENQTIQQEIQHGEEIILTERPIPLNASLNYLTLKIFIQELTNSTEPDQTFAQLRDKNIEKYCFGGVNCKERRRTVYHLLPNISDNQDVDNASDGSSTNNKPYPWLSGSLCDNSIQYQYHIVGYKYDEGWQTTKPILTRLKLRQSTNNPTLPMGIEFKLSTNNPAKFKKNILFDTDFFRTKQGAAEITNGLMYYNTLTDCIISNTNSEADTPSSVDACTAVKFDSQCKQSEIQMTGAISQRIFQFPSAPVPIARLSIQYPTSWGIPVIQNCVHPQQRTTRGITTKTCDKPATNSPQIIFKWRHYKPLTITQSMTKQTLLGALQADMSFLQGQTLCGENYQYHHNVVANRSSIYPLVFSAGLSSNSRLWTRESIQRTTTEAAVKQRYQAFVKGMVVDSLNNRHHIKLLNVSTLGQCKNASWSNSKTIQNNQQKTYNMRGFSNCPYAKIDNIKSSCTRIKNSEFKFEFKPLTCSTGKRHLIVIERSSNLANNARMIRKTLLNVLSTKLYSNTREIPAFDIVALDNQAKMIWRCEDFIQPKKPINALLAELKTRLKIMIFRGVIVRNPLDNFRFVKQALRNKNIKIRQLKSILYLNSGTEMAKFTDDDLDEAQNNKLLFYVYRYQLPLYLLQTNQTDCQKMTQYTSAKKCQSISQRNFKERLNDLLD